MLKEFRKTLAKVIHLRSIIGYNGMVFALKKTPLIGKLIPDRLYSTTFLKVIYWIFHVIIEVFKLFIGKIFGLGIIYLAAFFLSSEYSELEEAAGLSVPELYAGFAMIMFIAYALAGIMLQNPVFKCTTEKEYLVFMLRMDARKLNNALFAYDLAKLFIGYLIAGIIAAVTGAPFWLWTWIPVLAVLIKFFGTGFRAFGFRLKNRHHKPMKINTTAYVIRLSLIMMMFPLLFAVIANGYYLPLPVILTVSALLTALGVWGFYEYYRFDSNLHRRTLNDNIVRTEVSMYKEPDHTKNFKKLKAKGSVKGNKKGFEYLNALFVKRHFGMLYVKPVVFTGLVLSVMCLITGGFIYAYYERFGADNCVNMVFNNLVNMLISGHYEDALFPFENDSAGQFFRYLAQYHLLALLIPISAADNSFKSTQAMFINCDNSLMTFSFFKQREKIIRLFDIRLKQLFKINLAPALALGLCANLVLFYTGGQDYPFQYLVTLVIAAAICMIYSMIWLSLYYLFQPFTTTVNIKSGAYMAVRLIIGFILFIVVWLPANSLILAAVMVVFTALMIFVMRKLVYKFAPKTWKVKS